AGDSNPLHLAIPAETLLNFAFFFLARGLPTHYRFRGSGSGIRWAVRRRTVFTRATLHGLISLWVPRDRLAGHTFDAEGLKKGPCPRGASPLLVLRPFSSALPRPARLSTVSGHPSAGVRRVTRGEVVVFGRAVGTRQRENARTFTRSAS